MTDALAISATGLQAAVTRLDVVANNIANATTTGFKPSRVDQVSLKGGGVSVAGVRIAFSSGPLRRTDAGFALALQGDGFLQLDSPEGLRFTRSGGFHLDAVGNLVSDQGLPLSPPVQVPDSVESILVTGDGRVLAIFGDGAISQVGQVQTVSFANPGGLLAEAGSLFAQGPASGPPELIPADQVLFGALEDSTTDLGVESLDAFLGAAAFRANAAVIKVEDRAEGALLDILG